MPERAWGCKSLDEHEVMKMPERMGCGYPYRTASQPTEHAVPKKPRFRFGKRTRATLRHVGMTVVGLGILAAALAVFAAGAWLLVVYPTVFGVGLLGLFVLAIIAYVVVCMWRDAHDD